jgi:hypothetical protein
MPTTIVVGYHTQYHTCLQTIRNKNDRGAIVIIVIIIVVIIIIIDYCKFNAETTCESTMGHSS